MHIALTLPSDKMLTGNFHMSSNGHFEDVTSSDGLSVLTLGFLMGLVLEPTTMINRQMGCDVCKKEHSVLGAKETLTTCIHASVDTMHNKFKTIPGFLNHISIHITI